MIIARPKILLFLILLATCCSTARSQPQIGVIADMQSPVWIEMLWSEGERNVEAADTLRARLLREPVSAVFFPGDLVAIGNYDRYWVPVDRFLNTLHHRNVATYAVPGNHEYSLPASAGIADFYKRFPAARSLVEAITVDSVAMVLLDANYGKLNDEQKNRQAARYKHCMDSLQSEPGVRAIVVCAHQSPYTNSTGVRPDKEVQERLVPGYIATPKAVLFLSGHSHNLEWFRRHEKNFLVIGGGGGLRQPLLSGDKQRYYDLMPPGERIRYFYIIIRRECDILSVKAKGMNANDFSKHIEKEILRIPIE